MSHPFEEISHTACIWRWSGPGHASRHYLTIDGEAGAALSETAIMRRFEGSSRGFGSLMVRARIGETRFSTSVFPIKATGMKDVDGWLLPLRAAVRRAAGIDEGDEVEVTIEV